MFCCVPDCVGIDTQIHQSNSLSRLEDTLWYNAMFSASLLRIMTDEPRPPIRVGLPLNVTAYFSMFLFKKKKIDLLLTKSFPLTFLCFCGIVMYNTKCRGRYWKPICRIDRDLPRSIPNSIMEVNEEQKTIWRSAAFYVALFTKSS